MQMTCRKRKLVAGGRPLVFLACFLCVALDKSFPAEPAGVKVRLENYQGPAMVRVEEIGHFKIKIVVDPKTERNPLTLRVELPVTGPHTWPFIDVEVRDANDQPVSVRHSGTEWHKLLIAVPPGPGVFVVQAVDPPGERPRVFPEQARQATNAATGLSAAICNWHDGRRAALSLRFDDSHPTHLSKAIPLLREYGFRGTFMINPGGPDGRSPNPRWRSNFQDQRAEWEAVARRGDQEFANHTMRHRGANNDEEMEHEVGDAAQAIWELFPGQSRLIALNLGGGTQWQTTKTLRYYLDKYHLFLASDSLGMDDVYGDRVAAFRKHLEQHLERGGWCRVHFHYIGENLSTSEAHFRAALEIAKEHAAELWIAGMADIYKYQSERQGAQLDLAQTGPDLLSLKLSCSTKPELYDQPLTMEIALPNAWPTNGVAVKNAQAIAIPTRIQQAPGRILLRFDVAPRSAAYTVAKTDLN